MRWGKDSASVSSLKGSPMGLGLCREKKSQLLLRREDGMIENLFGQLVVPLLVLFIARERDEAFACAPQLAARTDGGSSEWRGRARREDERGLVARARDLNLFSVVESGDEVIARHSGRDQRARGGAPPDSLRRGCLRSGWVPSRSSNTASLRAPQSGRCRRSCTIRASRADAVRRGLSRGRRLCSCTPATPCSRNRFSHRYPVGRVISNSRHRLLRLSPRLARPTNSTRCSRTPTSLHDILSSN